MKESILYKFLIDSGFLSIDKDECETIFTEDIKIQENKLKEMLDKNQMKEVYHYEQKLISHMINVRDIEGFKMLYLGIKLGLEVGEFCAQEFNKE